MEPRLYTLVRKDLGKSYGAVQAAHSVAEYLLRGPKTKWSNGTMVLLEVKDLKELEKWADKLDDNGIKWKGFLEPDRNNEMTSLSTVYTGEVFKKLPLF